MLKTGKALSFVAAALLAAVVSLTACAPPKPPQQFTLRIGILPTQDSLPFFVMLEKGFGKKHGVDLVPTTFPGGAAILREVAAGSLDMGIGVGTVPVLSAAQSRLVPQEVVVVAANNFADPKHPGAGVLVRASIQRWQDLRGQQIAVNLMDSLQGAAIRGRMLEEGVSEYKLVEIPFPNMGLAVSGGNVAAAVMNEPFLTQSLLRGDGKILDWVIGGRPFETMEFSTLVAGSSLYRANPSAVKAFLRAYLQAQGWINQNQDAARVILGKHMNLSTEVSSRISLLRFSLDGRNDPTLLDGMQSVLVDVGMLKARIPVSQLYDETLLKEVLAEKR